jgi:type IV pilus assembly protein PilW
MVALVLSLVIGAAVLQMFLASKTTYSLQDAMARIQENGRFAVSFLASDIRMAGFMGCGNLNEITINVIANPAPIDAANPLGQIIGGANNVGSTNTWNAVAGTDVLSIRRASSAGVKLVGNMASDNSNIQLENNSMGLVAGDALFLSDCISADLFRATNVSSGGSQTTIAHANNFNTSNKLSKAYGDDAELLVFESINYFVRNTGRSTASGDRSMH